MHEKIEYKRGAVFVLNEKEGQLSSVYTEEMEQGFSLRLRLGIAGQAAVTQKSLLIPDVYQDERFDQSFDKRTGYKTRNILCVPLVNLRRETIGVVQAINKKDGDFSQNDLSTLESISGVIAIVIENASLLEEYDCQFHSFLGTLAASIDAKDALTAGHSRRVADIALGIARVFDYPEEEQRVLQVAALLHDYGKIGINDSVLKKPAALDPKEYAHIKTHANMTFDILNKIHFARQYANVPLIAASHHECLDGSGYPDGLKELAIPFMAKILSVADVFEALTADRHYRKGMSYEKALEILDEGIGKKFDEHIVKALKQYLNSLS